MNDNPLRSAPFSLNTPSLTTDSRRLAGLIKRLHDSQNMPARSEAITDILNELTTYAFETLAHEEQALASLGIAISPTHAEEHLRFQEYVANQCLRATLGVNAPNELLHFLIGWWHYHVQGTDLAEIPAQIPSACLCRP